MSVSTFPKASVWQQREPGPVLSDRQYRLWSEMLENRTGVRIAAERDDYVRGQISRRMVELGLSDADTYFRDVLETIAGTVEWGLLLDRLLVKETRFFRHRASHDYVRERLIKQLKRQTLDGPYNMWSVGCSTGEETYSLAITAFEGFRQARRKPVFGVIGTDISRGAIAFARNATFLKSRLGGISDNELRTYFEPVDNRQVRVKNAVTQKVCFITDNMLDENDAAFVEEMDVVFCQNVLIYFKRWRRRDIVSRLVKRLKPNGCLVVGPGELSDWHPKNLKRDDSPGVQVYVRVD